MSVVRDFCGHGLGRLFHDEPNIVHVGRPGEGIVLKPGMFFTVEPMINLGRAAREGAVRRLDRGDPRPLAVGAVRALASASPRPASRSSRCRRRASTSRPIRPDVRPAAATARLQNYRNTVILERVGLVAAAATRRVDQVACEGPWPERSATAKPASPRPRRTITAIASGCATRFRDAGADALSDYELLELVLFRAMPRRDVKPLAKTLIETFGSFAEVDCRAATRGSPKSRGSATPASPSSRSCRRRRAGSLRGEVKKRPVLSSWSSRARLLPHRAGVRRPASSSACCSSTSATSSSPTKCSRPAPSTTRRSIRARWSSARWNCRPPRSSWCTIILLNLFRSRSLTLNPFRSQHIS